MTPKPVCKAIEFYDNFVDHVIRLFEVIDESVETLVEEWSQMVKIQGDLKQNMCIWHFELF